MPYFQELHTEWSSGNGVILLTVDLGEPAGIVKDFVRSHGYDFPVLLDSGYEVGQKYGIRYTPTTLLVDKEGKLQLITIGAFKNKAAIEKQLASFLSK